MSREILLDTNALLWLVADPGRIEPVVLERLLDPDSTLMVSAVSAWEMAIKTRSGRLPGGDALVSAWSEAVSGLRAQHLPVEPDDALLAGSLDWSHRDPVDRMLVAQARRHMVLASSDDVILGAALVPTLDTRRGR